MRIAIHESSTGSGPHVAMINRGLCALGHTVAPYQRGQGADLVIVHGQVAHRTDYSYPHFPDERIPMAFVDFAEFGYFTRLPERAKLFANCFTPSAIGHDTKNRHEQIRLKSYLDGRSFPYFLREKHRLVSYPAGYHPIDYPLYHLSHCDARPNREEYLRRDLDLFCWWGHSHPWRPLIADALRNAHVRAEIGDRWTDENMPQDRYFERTGAAKCSVSFDGYGSGSFRMTEVLVRTLLLQGPLAIETRAPLVDGETCRMYQVKSDGEEFCGTNVAEVMRAALADPEGSYAIYERGYEHCMAHLTEKATAQYLLDVVAAHDWSTPTELEVAR